MLPAKYMALFEEMSELFDSIGNYKVYRTLLLSQLPPMNPYLGIFLRDLTFLEMGNPHFLDSEKKIINFDKYRMISAILQDLKQYQQVPYPFSYNPELSRYLSNLLVLEEERLYSISVKLEPLPQKKKKI